MSVALILPFRHNPNRDSNVPKLCVKAWLEQPMISKVIFVDGSAEKLDLEEHEKIIHIHVPYEGYFNLSFMRNVGARRAVDLGIKYLQIMDCDIFPQTLGYIKACITQLKNADMIRPYVLNSPISVPNFNTINDKDGSTLNR